MNQLTHKSRLIQQLRGFAILLVVAYHLGLESFSMGYLGVDMFFVISGYVMMQSCYGKVVSHSFSVTHFLKKRCIRLLPALTLVIVTVVVISSFFLTKDLQKTINYTAFFGLLQISNLYFYKSTGNYFDAEAQLNPFLHLWSLSMEFQFYIILSMFVYLVCRFKKSNAFIISTIVSVFFVSIAISFRPISGEPFYGYTYFTGFYGLPSRAWEFASGAIVFFLKQGKVPSFSNMAWLKSISYSGVFVSLLPNTGLPQKFLTISMVCGAALLILLDAPRENEKRSRLASSAGYTLEKIGEVSYSIYLWHFPAITLGRLFFPFENLAPYFAFFLCLPVVILSHRYIEVGFQNRFAGEKIRFRYVFASIASFALSIFLLNILPIKSNAGQGMPLWHEVPGDHPAMSNGCIDRPIDILACQFGTFRRENNGQVVVLGDSQAYAAATGVIEAARELDLKVFVYASSGCPFFAQTTENVAASRCSRYRISAFEFVEKTKPQIVYIANRTTGYLTREWRWNLVEDIGSDLRTTDRQKAQSVWRSNLETTVSRLTRLGVKVLIQQSIPDENRRSFIGIHPTRFGLVFPLLSLSKSPPSFAQRDSALDFAQTGREIEFALLRKYEKKLFLIDAIEVLCNNDSCPIYSGEKPIYLDWGHLSPAGSLLLVDKIKASISKALDVEEKTWTIK